MTARQNSDYYKVSSDVQQVRPKDHRLGLQEKKEVCIFGRNLTDQGSKPAIKIGN
jgi:hypothetical protein